jgi:hypothetical protein
VPGGGEGGDLGQDFLDGPAPHPPAKVRDNAVRAEGVAAVLDLHERPLVAGEGVDRRQRFGADIVLDAPLATREDRG